MGNAATKPSITLYHYTDKEGKDAIIESRFIKMSTDTQLDAILGVGVYLTSMSPFDNSREDIAKNNWSGIPFNKVEPKTHYVFEVKLDPGTNLSAHKKDDRDIYVFGLENLVLDLLEDWTLYDWTSDTPKKIRSGKFRSPQQSGVPAYQ